MTRKPSSGPGHGGPAKGAGSGPASGIPARGSFGRPDAEPGNVMALRHGAKSRRVVDPVAADLVEEVLGDPVLSYLREPRYRAALRAWSRAEARVLLLAAALDRRGIEDHEGSPSPWIGALERAESAAERARSRCGLDPASAARLGRDVAAARVDLAKLWSLDEEGEQ